MIEYLNNDEYNPYYGAYIDKATSTDIIEGLSYNLKSISTFFESIPKSKEDYAYADGKWTIKDILLHLIDTERVFSYRALRIARGDSTQLPGFDQDLYVENALATNRTLTSLIEEYKSLRQSTLTLFKTFTPEMLMATGTASDSAISVRAIGYILSGHENHHVMIIKDRYL